MSRALREQPRLSAKHMEVFDVTNATQKRRSPRPKVQRTCETCGEQFMVHQSELNKNCNGGRFCSRQCFFRRDILSKRTVQIACVACGVQFSVEPYRAATANFCSRKCRRRLQERATVEHQCGECGRVFYAIKNGRSRKFCSRACSAAAIRDRVVASCAVCGSEFETWPSRVARGAGKFCSPACRVEGRTYCYQQSKIGSDTINVILQRLPLLAIPELRVGRWAIDLAFPTLMIALELDGVFWHSHPPRVAADKRKDADLARQGWRVVRIPINQGDTADDLASVAIARITSLP